MCGYYQGDRTLPFYYASSLFYSVRVPLPMCAGNITATVVHKYSYQSGFGEIN